MRRLSLALFVLVAALAPTVARAHPLGNFTVNHYSRIEPAGDRVRILYVLDMAEIPTFQEKSQIDPDPVAYADRRAAEIGQNLRLVLNGTPSSLRVEQRTLSFPAGQGGLPTLRLEVAYSADLRVDASSTVDLSFRDDNDPSRIGWHEIVARPGAVGTVLSNASVPDTDVTNELRQYPDDLLNSPLNVREARLSFVPGAAAAHPLLSSSGIAVIDRTRGAFAELANGQELTFGFVLFALGVAIVLGAAHALQPGHGKTIVAAYLVGSRGTPMHALFLGATVTATHTAGVYALGLVTLFLSQYILPERLYPILEVVSGLLVVGIGVWLFGSRLLSALGIRRGQTHEHGHGHGFEGDHDHGVGFEHDHDHREHSQDHGRGFDDGPSNDAAHGHAHSHPHRIAYASEGHHHAEHLHVHRPGGKPHTHMPPQKVSLKSLLALGVSGGLLPCPEALMVLLITIAAHRVLFGLLLIVAFSTGLAGVLVGFGLLLVFARGFFSRLNLSSGFAPRILPVASALVIVIAGGVITAQALPQVL
jgi:nickel/cobalt exporter